MANRAAGPITRYLAEDHARLDGLLARAVQPVEGMDLEAFGEFRAGLLRHIAIEAKVDAAPGGVVLEPVKAAGRAKIDGAGTSTNGKADAGNAAAQGAIDQIGK